jgi:hypothetical protein
MEVCWVAGWGHCVLLGSKNYVHLGDVFRHHENLHDIGPKKKVLLIVSNVLVSSIV